MDGFIIFVLTSSITFCIQVNHVRCSPVEERQVLQVITEEIALMRRLSHPNIVRLHGVTREGPLYNIFVEWCAGKSVLYCDSVGISLFFYSNLPPRQFLEERGVGYRYCFKVNALCLTTRLLGFTQ